ncbi:MAG: AraC family transcriptional regulator [Oscillospiraceae bacterium]|nr:AraC family transcriptional regulator [Oscillospiraceae bacterium]
MSTNINTNRDLNYRLYLQQTSGFERTSFNREFERYADIRNGNTEQVKKNIKIIKKDYLSGKGKLSDDAIRNTRYHVIISAAMISRACVEGGMPHDTAYTLSDIFIQRADVCNSYEKLLDLLEEIHVDFAERMKILRKEHAVSIHVRKCIDYIYEHLNERLTLNELSEYAGLNETYFSRLFRKETGLSVNEFVHNAKITTAENMLRYSDFSYSEIALSLGFSSQSAFITLFRNKTGLTPKKYRDCFGGTD